MVFIFFVGARNAVDYVKDVCISVDMIEKVSVSLLWHSPKKYNNSADDKLEILFLAVHSWLWTFF